MSEEFVGEFARGGALALRFHTGVLPSAAAAGDSAEAMTAPAARIAARGETPFLHAFASNQAAIRLYGQLGFVHRSRMSVMALRRIAGPEISWARSRPT